MASSHAGSGSFLDKFFVSVNPIFWLTFICCCASVVTGASVDKAEPRHVGKYTAIGSDLLMAFASLIPRQQIPGMDFLADPSMFVTILHSLEVAYWSLPFGFVLMPIINFFRVPNRRMDRKFGRGGLPNVKGFQYLRESPLFQQMSAQNINLIQNEFDQAIRKYSSDSTSSSDKREIKMLPTIDDRIKLWTSLMRAASLVSPSPSSSSIQVREPKSSSSDPKLSTLSASSTFSPVKRYSRHMN